MQGSHLQKQALSILQLNANGLKNKIEQIEEFLLKNDVHVAALQETKLTEKSKIKWPSNYTLTRKDRGTNKGGGLAFLVRRDIPFRPINTPNPLKDDFLEESSILITGTKGDHLHIRNIYIPPHSSCQPNYSPPIKDILRSDFNSHIILGDFNAHSPLWHSDLEADDRGTLLEQEISDSEIGVLNEETPTRSTANCTSSPDITLASPNILPYTSWRTAYTLNSDHLPILVSVQTHVEKCHAPDRTFVNFKKANWEEFTKFTEEKFAILTPPTCPIQGEKIYNKIITDAAKRFIPSGRVHKIIPGIPSEAVSKIKQRDILRESDRTNPEIKSLNEEIEKIITDSKREKWLSHLDSCAPNSQKLWKTIKGITNPVQDTGNVDIKFNGTYFSNKTKIANLFNKQFIPNAPAHPTKESRKIKRKLEAKTQEPEIVISTAQVQKAIKESKNSKATGHDGTSPIMLKHLGPLGVAYLTNIISLSINSAIIPNNWKMGKIIPLLKPGKPMDDSVSYRQITLLSPSAKILEKCLLPFIETAAPLKDHQHGFRQQRSTVTALTSITNHIAKGLNQKKPANRTVLVALDLSKAFDTVSHEILLSDIYNLTVSARIKKFLKSYLKGRQSYTVFQGIKSKCRIIKQGVPQGGVLSPLLFNIYMSPLPLPTGVNMHLVSYADDTSIMHSGPDITKICEELNPYLDTLALWFESRFLQISAAKSSGTLFTTWSNEYNKKLPLKVLGKEIPTVTDPKILGMTMDPMLNFGAHARKTASKVSQRHNVLKALAGSTWGKSKEVLNTTFKAIGKSVTMYGAPAWTPLLSETNWQVLQARQNSALRTITGCTRTSDINDLHNEASILPVKNHCNMITDQFLLSMHQADHPNRHILSQPAPQRNMRKTITSRSNNIQHLVPDDGHISKADYKIRLKTIHSNAVSEYVDEYKSKILGCKPPPLCKSEQTLPRKTRSTLAQLRTGYSPFLKGYSCRIGSADSDLCPQCGSAPHTTTHLFSCPNNPTTLPVTALWSAPVEAASFLQLQLVEEETEEEEDHDPG